MTKKLGRPKKDNALSNADRQRLYRQRRRGGTSPKITGRPVDAKLICDIECLYYVFTKYNSLYRLLDGPFLTLKEANKKALFYDHQKVFVVKSKFFYSPTMPSGYFESFDHIFNGLEFEFIQ